MELPRHYDFETTGPAPPPAWKVRLLRTATRVPPLRSARVRAGLLRRQRARRRKARRAAESRGDASLSQPALFRIAERLDAHLPDRPGFFVEAGANDGFEQSNTYALERLRGWRGLLVEPVPTLHREAVLERPGSTVINAALVPFDYEGDTVTMRYGGLQSVVSGARGSEAADREWVAGAFLLGLEDEYTVETPARTLSSLLDEIEAPEIDLLSLDVEGYETMVLGGLDLRRHTPRLAVIETRDASALAAIEATLDGHMRAIEQISPFDVLFERVDASDTTRSAVSD